MLLVADSREASLVDFRHVREWAAANGGRGGKDNKHGADGADLLIPVPLGTMVFYEETQELLGDLTQPGQRLLVAGGGAGGVGNSSFKSGIRRSSRKTIPASAGEQARLRLEMHLPADVVLLGLPNAGKSSLLQAISEACPRIGDYPFTTQQPQLGVVCVQDTAGFELQRFVVADMPALVKDSSAGAGLGTGFLRHLHRSRLLLHVIDASADAVEVMESIGTLRTELAAGDMLSADRPIWLVLNKSDLATTDHLRSLRAALTNVTKDQPCYAVSAHTGDGCHPLCVAAGEFLAGCADQAHQAASV